MIHSTCVRYGAPLARCTTYANVYHTHLCCPACGRPRDGMRPWLPVSGCPPVLLTLATREGPSSLTHRSRRQVIRVHYPDRHNPLLRAILSCPYNGVTTIPLLRSTTHSSGCGSHLITGRTDLKGSPQSNLVTRGAQHSTLMSLLKCNVRVTVIIWPELLENR